MNVDNGYSKFVELMPEWIRRQNEIISEQDARFQVINRILTEVLGWSFSDIQTEPPTASGFIDYLLKSHGRNRLVVEAKRVGTLLIDTASQRVGTYKIGGPVLKSASDGIDQAKRYCVDTGVLFAALTTGFEWIAFWAIRSDGRPPAEGKAIVFPTLESIKENFATFHDLFSPNGVEENLYQIRIHEAEGLQVHHREKLEEPIPEHRNSLRYKSQMANDLDAIYRGFFSTMSGDNDPEMLAHCFVESKESREADLSLKKIADNLINRIDVLNSGQATELQTQIRDAIESNRAEFVVIIGNKGAGKSTFVDRFFRLVLEPNLRKRCLILKLDLADSPGEIETITQWLTDQLKIELERGLFTGGMPAYEDLQGVFIKEYDRWRQGERKFLYERDKQEFKVRFGEWMADVVTNHPGKYVEELLKNAVAARQLMPCIIFDNTDHFPQPFQERVFQFGQSIFRSTFSFILCPITDRTIWQLSKSGPMQSYETRALYLPVPSTKEVLAKRVTFIKAKTKDRRNNERGEYFLRKGIRLTIGDINAFAACVEELFINEDFIGRLIGWLSNHDIRRSLQIAHRIITSPVISIDDLVKISLGGGQRNISRRRTEQALIVGDYAFFNSKNSDFILNLFAVSPDGITSPLAKLSLLALLRDKQNEANDPERSYVKVEDVLNYFEPMKLSRSLAKQHLRELLEYRLVEPYDPTDIEVYEEQRIRITHAGEIHWEFALDNKRMMYVTQMALTTPMREQALVARIAQLIAHSSSARPLQRDDWITIARDFITYCLQEDRLFLAIPTPASYDGQRELRDELRVRWLEQLGLLSGEVE